MRPSCIRTGEIRSRWPAAVCSFRRGLHRGSVKRVCAAPARCSASAPVAKPAQHSAKQLAAQPGQPGSNESSTKPSRGARPTEGRKVVSRGKKQSSKRAFGPAVGRQRLAKVLAEAGVASRRASEDLITEGKVTVNGKQVLVPQTTVDPLKDTVKVSNKPLPKTAGKRYIFALNKPKGYLCASSTTGAGSPKLVVDLFKDWIEKEWKRDHLSQHAIPPRFFTVGRLDSQTTGLIFVTNDGAWAQSVQHPSSGLTKEYVVTTTAPATAKQLDTIVAGCEVDGAFVMPASLSRITDQRNKFRVTVSEGRNREVRLLVANAGLDVQYLKRVRIGGYRMERDLAFGQPKLLKPFDVRRVTDKSLQSS